MLVLRAGAADPQLPHLHPPLSVEERDNTPRPYTYVAPQPPDLPTEAELETVVISNRNYEITKASPKSAGPGRNSPMPQGAVAAHEELDEALFFKSGAGSGLKSRERLVIENCTFTMDFQEGDFSRWDTRRSAICVIGYREVVIRNCVFISKGRKGDPDRKTQSSINLEDCALVEIEDCYFEGMTNWMRGHVTVFYCGPTAIRRCEIAGQRQANNWISGGGIWVGNGIGERKFGTPIHADEPELMIYPSGPLLVEDCWIHDQYGRLNTDAIYIQNAHPFLIRNSRIENWKEDALIDVGFRDSAQGKYQDKPLANHGAVGVVENCEFADGHLKDSVGAGGGVVIRNSVMRNAWIWPYVFDGGSMWIVNNRFLDMEGVVVSGYEKETGGWVPREGMLINGSKVHLYENFIETKGAPPALYVSTPVPESPLVGNIVADRNVYALAQGAPALFADDRAVKRQDATLEDWRTATGNDKDSVLADSADALKSENAVPLPGKIPPLDTKPGLTGPVGPGAGVMKVAQELSAKVAKDQRAYAVEHALPGLPPAGEGTFELEDLEIAKLDGGEWIHPSKDASGGKYRLWQADAAGDAISFRFPFDGAGAYSVKLYLINQTAGGQLALQIDGQEIGQPIAMPTRMAEFPAASLSAGEHTLTLRLEGPADTPKTTFRFDRFDLIP